MKSSNYIYSRFYCGSIRLSDLQLPRAKQEWFGRLDSPLSPFKNNNRSETKIKVAQIAWITHRSTHSTCAFPTRQLIKSYIIITIDLMMWENCEMPFTAYKYIFDSSADRILLFCALKVFLCEWMRRTIYLKYFCCRIRAPFYPLAFSESVRCADVLSQFELLERYRLIPIYTRQLIIIERHLSTSCSICARF